MTQQPAVSETPVFDPSKHLIQLKGKLYLETKYRIQWFRQEHPRGCISTEIVSLDPVLVKATITSSEGTILGTAHAGAVDKGNAVWSGRTVEKSETAAIGRALAHAGYGTQFAATEDSAPLDAPANRYTPMPQVNKGSRQPQRTPTLPGAPVWSETQIADFNTLLREKNVPLSALKPGATRISDLGMTPFEAVAAVQKFLAPATTGNGGAK